MRRRQGGGKRTLRLSGGAFRGRKLKVGQDLRPTEGRVREALFSIWGAQLQNAQLLDLFAGSGAISLEGEGRGAGEVVAVDQRTNLLEENLAAVGSRRVEVLRGEVVAVLKRLRSEPIPPTFQLVFADPPYGYRAYDDLLTAVGPLLAAAGELVLEHSARRPMPSKVPALLQVDERRYGETVLSFYRPNGGGQG
ncbi:MAG: 16S rRNA (guanine(966)-N(2))-methyltransferase RsmD [Acidobacteriota bacterium]